MRDLHSVTNHLEAMTYCLITTLWGGNLVTSLAGLTWNPSVTVASMGLLGLVASLTCLVVVVAVARRPGSLCSAGHPPAGQLGFPWSIAVSGFHEQKWKLCGFFRTSFQNLHTSLLQHSFDPDKPQGGLASSLSAEGLEAGRGCPGPLLPSCPAPGGLLSLSSSCCFPLSLLTKVILSFQFHLVSILPDSPGSLV